MPNCYIYVCIYIFRTVMKSGVVVGVGMIFNWVSISMVMLIPSQMMCEYVNAACNF